MVSNKLACGTFISIAVSILAGFPISASAATENVLYSFCSQGGEACTDGFSPAARLINVGGTLYGTTQYGVGTGCGGLGCG
jgi:hypothetical protein